MYIVESLEHVVQHYIDIYKRRAGISFNDKRAMYIKLMQEKSKLAPSIDLKRIIQI